jgi:pantoate--beta-alanine ligase
LFLSKRCFAINSGKSSSEILAIKGLFNLFLESLSERVFTEVLKKNPVNIIGAPIFREESGLAMSSRNERLSKKTREEAKLIYETLKKIEDWFRIISIPEIYHRVEDIFKSTENMELEYLIIADEETLKETDFFYKDRNYRAFIVVNTENVRLIDNLHLY